MIDTDFRSTAKGDMFGQFTLLSNSASPAACRCAPATSVSLQWSNAGAEPIEEYAWRQDRAITIVVVVLVSVEISDPLDRVGF